MRTGQSSGPVLLRHEKCKTAVRSYKSWDRLGPETIFYLKYKSSNTNVMQGFRDLFYSNSVDIRPVPPDQYKLVYEIPGWNLSQRSQTTSMSGRMLEQNTSSICKDKETPKLKHFDHPDSNTNIMQGFRDLFHSDSVDIRTVPTEYKLVLDSR
ncbi:hypothetical protein RhiirA5_383392 [Rhizophagus irregularis]|uniref:Uncharacterized protein n=1 Tax=Rhizophagus irregularis TaxID=588596 RepID=A0A2N0NX75_9GLOM|nr:hypothetical protein RhiirA5_383392 [Rhizophagus irregularis]